jgi:PAS domain S-box-containing protein
MLGTTPWACPAKPMISDSAPLLPTQFSRLFEASPTAIGISHSPDGRFVAVNAAFLALHGYTREEVIGHSSAELGLWNQREERDRMLALVREHGRIQNFVYSYRHKSGRVGRALASVDIIDADGESYLLGFLTDVTEFDLAQQARAESETRLQTALKVTQLLVFHQDRSLRYTWIANPVLGLTAAAILGHCDAELLGPEAAAPLVRIKRRVMRTGRGERQEVWVTRDGTSGCYDLIVEPQRNPEGRILGVVCAAADITARKHAEQALAAAHRRLGDLAAHRQDALEAERRRLAQDVHDQVGATLTGIRMKLDALARRPNSENAACRSEIHAIVAMVEQAMTHTRDICTRLHPPGLDDLGLVATCRWYLQDWAAATGLRAAGRFSPLSREPNTAARIDLFRILQELLTNVARHAGASHTRVSLSGGTQGLRLRVADDGHGFGPNREAQGFGLTGVRERADRHGGRVAIDSDATGTRITVILPWRGLA